MQETQGLLLYQTETNSRQMISNQVSGLLRRSVWGRGASDQVAGVSRMEDDCGRLLESVGLEQQCSEVSLARTGICSLL